MGSIEACDSAAGRSGLSDADRRQLLHLDALRRGAADDPAGADTAGELWRVAWASGTDLDSRLVLKLQVGSMETVAWGEVGDRPLIAVGARVLDDAVFGIGGRLRLWDMLSGQSHDLPCTEHARCLAFAMTLQIEKCPG
ncbi:hypothetical protein D0T12_05495 [Actinomadura spongiicola]|uniref:Uncharacterized protein n=1 Tax=Actinomadura spongiicola TaxID=2303421 RepID=A0A372GL25_9ACTN|nr:hypothetical protein [Actinomadura spongiicola]RFS86086.1 hypothetical protein D0T12_05495 [Actinomadura spongiicola]